MKTKIEISTLSWFLLVVAHNYSELSGGGTECMGGLWHAVGIIMRIMLGKKGLLFTLLHKAWVSAQSSAPHTILC